MAAEDIQSSTHQTVIPSTPGGALGSVRHVVLFSIGLIDLMGTTAQALCQRGARLLQQPPDPAAKISRLALDEWEMTLARLQLPSKHDVETLTQQVAALKDHIDQIATRQTASN